MGKMKDKTEFAAGPSKSNWTTVLIWEVLKISSVVVSCIQLQCRHLLLRDKCEGLVPGPLLFLQFFFWIVAVLRISFNRNASWCHHCSNKFTPHQIACQVQDDNQSRAQPGARSNVANCGSINLTCTDSLSCF